MLEYQATIEGNLQSCEGLQRQESRVKICSERLLLRNGAASRGTKNWWPAGQRHFPIRQLRPP